MSPVARAAEERGAALEAARRLLALAMRESHPPVEVLAGALERMAAALAECARVLERERALEGEPSAPLPQDSLRDLAERQEALEHDIALCIESLQFHDRLMQRLERVRRLLSGCLSEQRASDGSMSGSAATAAKPAAERLCSAVSAEGSIELFE
jgi:hypothetical protein